MIHIDTEKIVVQGVASRKIVAVKGMRPFEDFPPEYSKAEPYISITLGELGGISVQNIGDMAVGAVLSEEKFKQLLDHVRRAAIRAHAIREMVRELEKTWCGKETFVI